MVVRASKELLKNKNGITLIALIITIIVMMILVGVTVSVALNGGLFNTASSAAKDTKKEADKEELQAAIVASYDAVAGTVDGAKLQSNLSGWTVEGEGPYTCTSPKENKFKVTIQGKVEDFVELNPLEKYILGENGEGKLFSKIFNVEEMTFIDDEDTTDVDESLYNVQFLNSSPDYSESIGDIVVVYIEYEEKIYRFQVSSQNMMITGDTGVNLVYEPKEEKRLGKYVQYDNKNWIVLYDNEINGIQMISADVLEPNVYLGYNDPTIDETKVEDINLDGNLSNIEKAIYSYNNAITTLNSKCINLISDKSKVATDENGNYKIRNVGSNQVSPISENAELYTSENLSKWPVNHATYVSGAFCNKGKSTDNNYISDLDRMFLLGIDKVVDKSYWLTSRLVYEEQDSENINFCVRVVLSGEHIWEVIWNVDNGRELELCNEHSAGVRPIISLVQGALDNVTGEGTPTSPYILD